MGEWSKRTIYTLELITGPWILNHLVVEQKDHEGALQGDSEKGGAQGNDS